MSIRFLAVCFVVLAASSCNRNVRSAICRQIEEYPETRVQDIYKSFCQDNLGPEHLIPDADAARNHLLSELKTYREDVDSGRYAIPAKRFVPVGDRGNYVRVDLSVVLDSLMLEDNLLDAFVRSANAGRNMTKEQWTRKWHRIASVIRHDFPEIPDCEKDLRQIDSLLDEGHCILHHSPAFNAAYHPHYRIIEHGIFEKEILCITH